jgi:hypothetical protein
LRESCNRDHNAPPKLAKSGLAPGLQPRAGMRWIIWVLALTGCSSATGDPTPRPDGTRQLRAEEAEGTTWFIHVGGMCSTSFSEGKGDARLGEWPGRTSVDAAIDQRHSMSVAVSDLRELLDARCVGGDWCYLYTFSNGGAVVSKTLSVHDASRWNILWVLSSASNEGGSELSEASVASLGDFLGVTCDLSNDIGPSDHRAGWDHDDTGGNTIYLTGGYHEWWYTGGLPDFFSGMANDGAVSYHSAAGLNDVYAIPDDDPWLCYEREYHYDHHEIAFSCRGFDLDHYEMKQKGIDELGG